MIPIASMLGAQDVWEGNSRLFNVKANCQQFILLIYVCQMIFGSQTVAFNSLGIAILHRKMINFHDIL